MTREARSFAMADTSFQPEPVKPPALPYASAFTPPLRYSGLAVASMICGVVGLATCCSIVPGILGVVFGGVALPIIKHGEARGRGLALCGVITGSIGVALGAAFWIALVLSPDTVPVKGSAVAASDKEFLRSIGVLVEGERLEYLCPTGMFTVAESGVVLTDRRLVIYEKEGLLESCDLIDIAAVEFIAAVNWLDESEFVVELDDGNELFFWLSSDNGGDRIFHRQLQRLATSLRSAAGRPAPKDELSPVAQEDNEQPQPRSDGEP